MFENARKYARTALPTLLLCLCGIALFGCAANIKNPHQAVTAFTENDRAIVYSADLVVEVESVNGVEAKVAAIVADAKGYVAQSRMAEMRYNATIRVPHQDLDTVLNNMAGLGTQLSRSKHAEDVTDRLIDYEAKLKNLLALRDRIRYLIENKSDSSNIVDMERELSRVQGELDSLQGQMETLKKRVAYSTLDLIVQQKRIYGPLGYLAHGAWWVISKLFVIR